MRELVNNILAKHTGKTLEEVNKATAFPTREPVLYTGDESALSLRGQVLRRQQTSSTSSIHHGRLCDQLDLPKRTGTCKRKKLQPRGLSNG